MRRIFTAFAAAAAVTALAAVPSVAAKTYTMKIGFVTINDSNHFAADWLKETLEKRSKGRLKVGVYPAAQLGTIPRQIEAIQLGTQEAFHIPPGFFIGINKAFMVTDAPGLFDDIPHQHRAVNQPKFRDKFMRLAENKGFVGNFVWSCGDTSIATIKPFRTLEEMKGRKIRVLATPLERAVIEKLGATGVPIPYSQVLPAMQRRTIDGVRSAVIVMFPSKFWTVAKYLTLTGNGHISCGQWLSTAWLKSLPADLREMVAQAGKEVTPMVGKWGHELTVKAEENWAKEATVYRLSKADQVEFRKRVAPIADDILGKTPETREMYALLKEAVAATRKK